MKITDEMVTRFLCWKLPADFAPDAGITFKPDYNVNTPWPMKHEPTGTNLLNAVQARAMLEHVLAAPDLAPPPAPPASSTVAPKRQEAEAAIATLKHLGYSWHGGELWKPPLGPIPERFRRAEPASSTVAPEAAGTAAAPRSSEDAPDAPPELPSAEIARLCALPVAIPEMFTNQFTRNAYIDGYCNARIDFAQAALAAARTEP